MKYSFNDHLNYVNLNQLFGTYNMKDFIPKTNSLLLEFIWDEKNKGSIVSIPFQSSKRMLLNIQFT